MEQDPRPTPNLWLVAADLAVNSTVEAVQMCTWLPMERARLQAELFNHGWGILPNRNWRKWWRCSQQYFCVAFVDTLLWHCASIADLLLKERGFTGNGWWLSLLCMTGRRPLEVMFLRKIQADLKEEQEEAAAESNKKDTASSTKKPAEGAVSETGSGWSQWFRGLLLVFAPKGVRMVADAVLRRVLQSVRGQPGGGWLWWTSFLTVESLSVFLLFCCEKAAHKMVWNPTLGYQDALQETFAQWDVAIASQWPRYTFEVVVPTLTGVLRELAPKEPTPPALHTPE
eukprot:TRINITY_DN103869_c0_g1_i1.p1 TRINITY_DN103869_c0_g1~~TRINITY_DN103869_c0_g1_i1.p1  ORF type:complete len:293 (+),score=31.26 TRINITY_DN103869_c0_g1_i1:26-880(+)